jgi:hypothetical protein
VSVRIYRKLKAGPATSGGGGGGYEGPLDLVPGAIMAYSVRALSLAMLGEPVFRLRRDSDDAELDFSADAVTGEPPVSEITTWLNGADGFVTVLYDQSGNGQHMSQETAAMQPSYLANQQNGMPSVSFPSSSSSYILQTPDNLVEYPNGELSSFSVTMNEMALGVYGDTDYVEIANGTAAKLDLFIDPDIRAGARFEDGAVPVEYAVWDGVAETGTRNYRVNGSALATSIIYDNETLSGSITGQGFLFGFDPVVANKVIEFLSYGTIITNENRTLVRQNMATFYGITLP